MNINITSIKNGFLVGTPPEISQVQAIQLAQMGQQPQPIVTYCETYDEVCQAIKRVWPTDISK